MSLTLFKRIDIDINWYFSAISLGFTLHSRGFQLSLIVIDIDVYWMSPKQRAQLEERFEVLLQKIEDEDDLPTVQ